MNNQNSAFVPDTEWTVTDPDHKQQYKRTGETTYYFKEVRQVSPGDLEWFSAEINLGEYSFEEMCDDCSGFGYSREDVVSLLETNPALIAECIFEML